ncbi:MAG: right-handed parallel beta-helix repeat-containing protein [Proteobacteria bacterium]|nr:right-handed parallel beta-helix repeat-containing protein [Pseudomonadota bacterium]MBU1058075.1 right-handed parallel beta-helix repeat-containing protein [Pseudomonadota bacterium]
MKRKSFKPPCAYRTRHQTPAKERLMNKVLCVCLLLLFTAVPCRSTVLVSSVSALISAVNAANGGGDKTILIADGYYPLHGSYLRITADGISVASASGKRELVILDGNYQTTEIFQIVASNVTLSDLTLQEASYHPIHVMAADDHDVINTVIRNVHIINPGQQAIKINQDGAKNYSANNGLIAGCLIELTETGRQQVWEINGSCYTGGIDAHHAANWTIRDNEIRGFWCADGLSEHGIHLWSFSSDTLVERNRIIDCDRGIGFGLGDSGHTGGIIRNNMLYHGPDHGQSDVGIGLESASGAQVYNNTLYHEHSYANAIEYRLAATTDVTISNNLSNRAISSRDEGSATLAANITTALPTWFKNPAGGDLHLSAPIIEIIDKGIFINGLTDDLDKERRPQGARIDIGADEYLIPSKTITLLSWIGLLL